MHQSENYHKSYIQNNYLQYSGYLYFLYHYFYCYHYLQFTVYNLNFTFNKNTIIIINYLLMSFFPDSRQVQGSGIVCLLNVLQVIGDNVYDLGKFLLYGSIFILCSFFSCSFLAVCVSVERVLYLGSKSSSFFGITVSKQLSLLIFTLEELLLIYSYLEKVLSKSCKNVNCIMIGVFVLRCIMIGAFVLRCVIFITKQMKG